MESLIIAYGLELFIDGSLTAPPSFLNLGKTVLNPRFTNWNRPNNLVKNWIYASVSNDMNSIDA